jgi:hypothetical protein
VERLPDAGIDHVLRFRVDGIDGVPGSLDLGIYRVHASGLDRIPGLAVARLDAAEGLDALDLVTAVAA